MNTALLKLAGLITLAFIIFNFSKMAKDEVAIQQKTPFVAFTMQPLLIEVFVKNSRINPIENTGAQDFH